MKPASCPGCGHDSPIGFKFCSAPCRRLVRAARERRRLAKLTEPSRSERPCSGCGSRFKPTHASAKFCTRRCAVNHFGRIQNRAKTRLGISGKKGFRKKARRLGVPYEPIDPLKVFARDGWRCQICGERTPKELRGTTARRAPELEHRVPWARGGAHTYDNVQCACRACNTEKRCEVRGQLPMFPRLGVRPTKVSAPGREASRSRAEVARG